MEITNILVEKLHTSPLNPRTRSAGKQADMELRHSMNRVGLLNPPTVRVIRQSESYEIIHGNRRVEAARKLKWKYISCFITKMNDQDCEIAATAENMVRTQMHPMDQFEAFENMLTLGESITTIATSFGVKEELVHQRLRLAKLAPVAKKEFRKGAISLDACCALTLGTHTQQRELLKAGIKDTWAIERKLGEGSVNMSVALFDQALYKGKFTTDLFGRDGTETYALDRVEFHSLQFNYMIDKLTEPSDWLFQKISELDAWKIKKIDGKAVTQEYVQDSKKLTKKVKAKLGVIYSLNPLSCKVVSSYWIYKKMPKSKDSTTTTANRHTPPNNAPYWPAPMC